MSSHCRALSALDEQPILASRISARDVHVVMLVATGSPIQQSVTAWIHAAHSHSGDRSSTPSPPPCGQSDRLLAGRSGVESRRAMPCCAPHAVVVQCAGSAAGAGGEDAADELLVGQLLRGPDAVHAGEVQRRAEHLQHWMLAWHVDFQGAAHDAAACRRG